ncbi:unnamed protein product [Spirodela intermedia]|uniref:Uncharacterized protein n=1 Tax=Spirodela intermedia TaxID=51605 RepID=A0A7I8LCC6_SPIIN|nr:unnamed protein product [Spirodela intermedia]
MEAAAAAGDVIIAALPINDDGGGQEASGGELEVALQVGSESLDILKSLLILITSDAVPWCLFIAYMTLYALALLVWILCHPSSAAPRLLAQRRHQGKLLAAAYVLRVLVQVLWGLTARQDFSVAVLAGLQLFRTTIRPQA